jgi:hypothetical protein
VEYKNVNFIAGWDADEWAYVCARLGVLDNQMERVTVKFCDLLYGCNFAICPHGDKDDRRTIFGLGNVGNNSTAFNDVVDSRSTSSNQKYF